jgi:uncharacterized protein YbcV (DUF1398 family)
MFRDLNNKTYPMNLEEQLAEAYKTSANYPDLILKLITLAVHSYTVDVATGICLYRFEGGRHILHQQQRVARTVSEGFNYEQTVAAVKNTQRGKTSYPEFLDEIARAGVRFYEATLTGNLRVTYIGAGGFYEEDIPIDQNLSADHK